MMAVRRSRSVLIRARLAYQSTGVIYGDIGTSRKRLLAAWSDQESNANGTTSPLRILFDILGQSFLRRPPRCTFYHRLVLNLNRHP